MSLTTANPTPVPVTSTSNQDKLAWCNKFGTKAEREFIAGRLFDASITGYFNPDKRDNIYTHDLMVIVPSDVKTVRTPFFTAKRYGVEPQKAITFNRKDVEHYRTYPLMTVLFDVIYAGDACKSQWGSIAEVNILAVAPIVTILNGISSGKIKCHEYLERTDDKKGNAKDSFVLDYTWFNYYDFSLNKWIIRP